MTPEQTETVADLLSAHAELTDLVRSMELAWQIPGKMAVLVEQASQRLVVLLHNAEYLGRTVEGHECSDCAGRGHVSTCTGGIRTCPTCNGKGVL